MPYRHHNRYTPLSAMAHSLHSSSGMRHCIVPPLRLARAPISEARTIIALTYHADRARRAGLSTQAQLLTLALLGVIAGEITTEAVCP